MLSDTCHSKRIWTWFPFSQQPVPSTLNEYIIVAFGSVSTTRRHCWNVGNWRAWGGATATGRFGRRWRVFKRTASHSLAALCQPNSSWPPQDLCCTAQMSRERWKATTPGSNPSCTTRHHCDRSGKHEDRLGSHRASTDPTLSMGTMVSARMRDQQRHRIRRI